MLEIVCQRITSEGTIERITGMEAALSLRKAGGGGYIWIDIAEPTREALESLVEPLGLNPLWVEDCLDEAQIPKIETFPTGTFTLFNTHDLKDGLLSMGEVNIMLGKDFLITVSGRGGRPCEFPKKLSKEIGIEADNLKSGPDFLMHLILDYIVDEKSGAIESIQEVLEAAEETIISDHTLFDLSSFIGIRRDLLTLRRSLFHEREILTKICRRDSPFIGEKSIYHFRDIYDHITKYYEEVELSREMLTSLMEMYLSMVNNRISVSANRTNNIVRRLTFITTVFMPLTLLAGIGGMSEWSMMTGPDNWKIAYPAFMALMAIIGVASYFALRMLDRRDTE